MRGTSFFFSKTQLLTLKRSLFTVSWRFAFCAGREPPTGKPSPRGPPQREKAAGKWAQGTRRESVKARPGFAILAALAAALLLLPVAASAACPNEGIRAAQKSSVLPEGSIHLPDCMALEQVSATKKENQYANNPAVSADGERVRYYSGGALGDTPNLNSAFWNRYVAGRGGSGWSSAAASPREKKAAPFSAPPPAYGPGAGAPCEPISPRLVPIDAGAHTGSNIANAKIFHASADHSRFYFGLGDSTTAYIPRDPEPTGSGD